MVALLLRSRLDKAGEGDAKADVDLDEEAWVANEEAVEGVAAARGGAASGELFLLFKSVSFTLLVSWLVTACVAGSLPLLALLLLSVKYCKYLNVRDGM